jgi:hypothetical protein
LVSLAGWRFLFAGCVLAVIARSANGDDEVAFYRGLNLNGPAVSIDGNPWQGKDASWYTCDDQAFENQRIALQPETDASRAEMIRSSRYGGNQVTLRDVEAGIYTVFLYVWEDNNTETYSVSVNGQPVAQNVSSGLAGQWQRLGPWRVTVRDDHQIVVASRGGTANFSGIEVWRGQYDGLGLVTDAEQLAFFENRIRPLLVDRCYSCHSKQCDVVEGGLLVDSRATLRSGGGGGAAVVPGDPDNSLLIRAVRYQDDDLQMPPDESLNDSEIADLTRWVAMGAPDPRFTATKHAGKKIDVAKAREFWSLRPIEMPTIPQPVADNWSRGDLDRLVLAKMTENGLYPAEEAEKRVLLRRATYDLTGLPPTIDQLQAFLADDSDDAFAKVVDRLLESPRYGERWGRHWLDVVRYADTAGDNSDFPVPQVYRYRDWVIDAFNRDLPFDEFVRDQLAGDLRGGDDDQQRFQRIIATGYLAGARRFGSRVDDYPQHLTIEDTIDNLGRAFLGLTLSCARCHDHKFDPITAADYYAIYGIFHSTRYPWPGIELDQQQRDFVPLIPTGREEELRLAAEQRASEQTRLDAEVKRLAEEKKKAGDDGERRKKVEAELVAAQKLADQLRKSPAVIPTAYAVADSPQPSDVPIQIKGDPAQAGDLVERRFLTIFGGQQLPDDVQGSGRLQLAEWILAPENCLTPRVMANRIWQHHFAQGLVATPNDFGKQGKPPTHPELLDYLAIQLRDSGWSIKAMHRLIMNSSTYRQSSLRDAQAIAADPTNQWLAGYPRLRLDAESLRDTLLFHGGNLDLSPAGEHPFPPAADRKYTQHAPFKEIYPTDRRSIFLMTQRIQRHPFLAIFDGADPSASTAARMTSTTPVQALFLLNNPLVQRQAELFAGRIVAAATNDEDRIEFAFTSLFARPATAVERDNLLDFLTRARTQLESDGVTGEKLQSETWSGCVRALLRTNEFIYLD